MAWFRRELTCSARVFRCNGNAGASNVMLCRSARPRAVLVMLRLDPRLDVVAAIEDAAAKAEAARAGAEVAPIAESGNGSAEQCGGFGDGEQIGVGPRDG